MNSANTADDGRVRVPPSAAWLGGLGAVPFIALAGMLPVLEGGPRQFAAQALLGYGAMILSFLGGIQWGLAIAPRGGTGEQPRTASLIVSVVPSLAGWAALLAAGTAGLLILAVSVAAMLWVDLRATRRGAAPAWYPKLRIPLTAIVVAALLFGALA